MKPLAYVNSFKDRYGVRRYYFRRFGKRTPLPGRPGQPGFQAAYADALKGSTFNVARTGKAGPGSMAALVRAYRSTTEFQSCKASTQRAYNQALNEIEARWGKYPVAGLTRAKVRELMQNRADEPKKANRLHKRLKAIMELALELGWVQVNPVGKKRPFRVRTDGYPEWPEPEIVKFQAHWPRGSKQRLAFDLILSTGQRSIDVVAMTRNHIESGRIRVIQEKTNTPLWIPLSSELRATLDAAPLGGLFLVETEYGRPRSVKGFYNWMKKAMRAAGLDPALSPHGGRKAAATRLCDVGCSAPQICSITGHASVQQMERYIQNRDQRRLADSAIEMLERNKNGN